MADMNGFVEVKTTELGTPRTWKNDDGDVVIQLYYGSAMIFVRIENGQIYGFYKSQFNAFHRNFNVNVNFDRLKGCNGTSLVYMTSFLK